MNLSRLLQKERISFHRTAQELMADAYSRWNNDETFDIWEEISLLRREMGDFPTLFLLSYYMHKQLCTQAPEKVHRMWMRCKKNIVETLRFESFSQEEIIFAQELFRSSLLFALPLEEDPSFVRAAEVLDLPISANDIVLVQGYLATQKEVFLDKKVKSPLEALIATEFQCFRRQHTSLLLPLFALNKDKNTPAILHDVHSARAFAACWSRIEEELEHVRDIQKYFRRVEFTSQWSFGDMRTHYVVIYLQKEENNADFSWGNRHIRIFEEMLPALEWLWNVRPTSSIVLQQHCSFPNAQQCASVILRDGLFVHEESLVGYVSPERIFLDGGFWSSQGVLEKDKSEEEEKKQREAKEELARLLLDSDDLSLD